MSDGDEVDGDGASQSGERRRYTRRLSDKILIAFHQACDGGELDVAGELLRVCVVVLNRPAHPGRDRRRNVETLVAAYERLWLLRNPDRV